MVINLNGIPNQMLMIPLPNNGMGVVGVMGGVILIGQPNPMGFVPGATVLPFNQVLSMRAEMAQWLV